MSHTGPVKRELRVLTFNVWFLEIFRHSIARDILPRLERIPSALKEIDADIVCFQEVWSPWARKRLITLLQHEGFSHFAYSRPDFPFGNGLLIASKYELSQEVQRLEFSISTNFIEKFVRKGAIKTQVNLPKIGWVDIYNTHLGSVSFHHETLRPNETEDARKRTQLNELKSWIAKTRRTDDLFLFCDLNTHHSENGSLNPDYSQLIRSLDLADTSQHLHQQGNIWTYDAITNPYAKKGIHGNNHREFVDYILGSFPKLQCLGSQVVFQSAVKNYNLSDHYGLMTKFSF